MGAPDICLTCVVGARGKLPEIMDLPQPIFHGITSELSQILNTLGVDSLNPPLWSIRQTGSKIYLDLAWSKHGDFPAKTCDKETNAKLLPKTQSGPVMRKPTSLVNHKTHLDATKVPKGHKKRKSPSTRRRDRERFQAWVARKRQQPPGVETSPVNSATPTQEQPGSVASPSSTKDEQETQNPALKAPEQEPVELDQNVVTLTSASDTSPSATDLADDSDIPVLTECSKHPTERYTDPGYMKFLEEITHARDLQTIYLSHFEYALENIKPCIKCSAVENTPDSHKQCSKCKLAKYCSKSCQKEHWKNSHKLICAEHCNRLAQDPVSACEKIYKDHKEYITSLLEGNPEYSNMLNSA